ncbi:MAG: hypothetical protein ACMUIU_14265 [bacterium]
MTNRLKTVGFTIEVNVAILLAKRFGLIRPRIAVRGAVVIVTVGTVKVTGAFPLLNIGSTRRGEEIGLEKSGIAKGVPGNMGFKKTGSIDHRGNTGKKGAC